MVELREGALLHMLRFTVRFVIFSGLLACALLPFSLILLVVPPNGGGPSWTVPVMQVAIMALGIGMFVLVRCIDPDTDWIWYKEDRDDD